MANYWYFMMIYLFASVWLIKGFPTNVLYEHMSSPDIADDSKFNGTKIV